MIYMTLRFAWSPSRLINSDFPREADSSQQVVVMKPGTITLGPPEGTIEGATRIQTPSQAELGLGGVSLFRGVHDRGNAQPPKRELGLGYMCGCIFTNRDSEKPVT